LEEVVEVHEEKIRNGFFSNVLVEHFLVDIACKCGRIKIALDVFEKNWGTIMVPWTMMIVGFVQIMCLNEALFGKSAPKLTKYTSYAM